MERANMDEMTRDLPTKSAKIRALNDAGVSRSRIAEYLGIRYQHVRNVIVQGYPASQHNAVQNVGIDISDKQRTYEKLIVADDGTLCVPGGVLQDLGVGPGDAVYVMPDDTGVRLVGKNEAVEAVRQALLQTNPAMASLVDELVGAR